MTKKKENQEQVSARHGSNNRDSRVEITFTDEEWVRFNRLFEKSGEKSRATYARKRLLRGRALKANVTPDDRRAVTRLSEIAGSLDELLEGLKTRELPDDYIQKLDQLFANFDKFVLGYCAKLDNK